uniref:Uncharacterized protein n=1 Tax=Sphaerodactylus townsendi TaxID=933632 RepID=A0ACB8E8H0_9SAUR
MNVLLDFLWLLVIIIYSYVEALVKLFIPVKRKSVSGEIVLITGAGHGLGRLTAYKFAKHQSKLVLWDINKHGVEETAEACRRQGSTAYAFTVDCSNREEIYSTAEKKSHLLSSPPDPLPRELCFIVICDMYLSQTIARANKLVANHVYRNASKFRQDIDKKKEEVKREIGDVSILVNNAGVVATADLLSTQDKQIQKTFEVNILAHHWVIVIRILAR